MSSVALTRHESPLGCWQLAHWTPPLGSPLAGTVDRIWSFDGVLGAALERVFPDATLELIVQLDTPHRPGEGSPAERFPPVCVTGLRTTAEVVEAPPERCRVVGIRFVPLGAFRVLGVALSDFTALTVDLHAILGRGAAELGTRVAAARDCAAALGAARAWAEERVARGPLVDRIVERALSAIVADGGHGSIAAIDAWQGRSRARFAAAFRDSVGVTPKRLARIVRFDRSLRAIANGSERLGEIALAAGYYDQAHFTSEFREHAGITPGAHLRAARFPGTTNLADRAEQFFQDTAS